MSMSGSMEILAVFDVIKVTGTHKHTHGLDFTRVLLSVCVTVDGFWVSNWIY
jgi:hypothetical protein